MFEYWKSSKVKYKSGYNGSLLWTDKLIVLEPLEKWEEKSLKKQGWTKNENKNIWESEEGDSQGR